MDFTTENTMPKTSRICVDILSHLQDCPPGDNPIPEDLLGEIAEDVFAHFDFTGIYDRLDTLACQALRRRGIEP